MYQTNRSHKDELCYAAHIANNQVIYFLKTSRNLPKLILTTSIADGMINATKKTLKIPGVLESQLLKKVVNMIMNHQNAPQRKRIDPVSIRPTAKC